MAATPLVERIQALVARATRYPIDLLVENADLEDELGIDSVKQVEIVALLKAEMGLPSDLTFKRDEVRTIASIAALVAAYAGAASPGAKTDAPPPPAPPRAPVPAPIAARTIDRPREPAPGPAPPDRTEAGAMSGKVVLVTGSGRGLGRTIALALAAEGATVVVNSFHSRDAGDATCADIVQAGGKAMHAWGSVANEEHVARIFDEIGRRFGRLDGLVANASDGFIGPFDALTPAHWDRGFRTNVVGLHLCAVAAARLMPAGGQVVTMSTITSNRYLRDFTCQGVLKAAVEALTRYLAVELAPRGVRVNCISAGPVDAELIRRFPNAEPRIAHWESITPTRRLTSPEEVARTVAFLIRGTVLSANGSVITLDGGVSLGIDADVGTAAEMAPAGASAAR